MSERTIRIAIVDDSASDCKLLCDYIWNYCSQNDKYRPAVTCFEDGQQFVNQYRGKFDAVFLDICMKHMDGMSAARKIRTEDQQVILIFTTNMAQMALEGYDVRAMDFLIKPISSAVFFKRMDKIVSELEHRQAELTGIIYGREIIYIDAKQILYAETYNKRMLIHMTDGDLDSGESMQSLVKKLSPEHFFECHRSFLVNFDYIENVTGQELIISGKVIPVSKYRKREFREMLAQYLGEKL